MSLDCNGGGRVKPKFRAWLKEEYRMIDVREITFFYENPELLEEK